MVRFDAPILSNRTVAPSWKEMALGWEPAAGKPVPGQFLTLRPGAGSDPLLRRPFALASYIEGGNDAPSITILYQVRGPATSLMAGLGPGSTIDVLGPLGKGFPLPLPDETPMLAAGGVGLGPILFLARSLEAARVATGASGDRTRPRLSAPLVVGFRATDLVPDIAFPPGFVLCTDDGSAGTKGTPVDWMAHNAPAAGARLYACGPSPMLAAIARLAASRGWAASLSAEQWMACGVGACMGCVLPRPSGQGFLRACADGPVFELGDIDWEKA